MHTAKIIAVTEPRIWTDAPDTPQKLTVDEFIAYVARVSNPDNQNNMLTANKLLRYLAKHKHWSPFEMVNVVMEINTTRDIARQVLRHRSFAFQEFSQRYAALNMCDSVVVREARLQDTKNRQNSIEIPDGTDDDLVEGWNEKQRLVTEICQSTYQWALKRGIAKEQARVVLPEGLTHSRLYVNGTLRSWVHYIQLRTGNGTQKEHREMALACADAIKPIFPMITEFVCNDS